ncbi:putative ABC transporter permease subunit [Pontibacillus litoralis]|uniref:Uncharacterized protein n=1 Tax=Pontibacillus litoralis JSM 072002 TaxID=1385512 RepID=A0A0A5HNU7_9BACI|nr:hypothetical protein [Pontibacillus litoralis]KGX85312.1 hypothetical protein N784_09735 [Pontibacillus litoralis JSM 072002]
MNKTFLLSKMILTLSFSELFKDTRAKRNAFFVFLGFLPLIVIWLYILSSIISSSIYILAPSDNEPIILGILFVLTAIITVLFSIPSVISSYYFADDMENYLTMPFHPYQLVIGKSLAPLLITYMVNLAILAPTMIFYGMATGSGILYVCLSIFIFILFPIIPFIVAALIVMLGMRYVNIAKNKDRSKVYAGIFSLVFIIGFNIIIRLNTNSNQMSQEIGSWLNQQEQLVWQVTKLFPSAYVATNTLTSSTWWMMILFLILFIVLTALALYLFITIGQRMYFKGMLGINKGGKGKKKQHIEKRIGSNPTLVTLTKKELKTIVRTPNFFMNCIVQSLFLPVFFVAMIAFDDSIGSIASFIQSSNEVNVLLTTFSITVFMLGINLTATSSISRDGQWWFTNLYIPIEPKTVIYSKVITAWIIEGISIILLGGIFLYLGVPTIPLLMWGILVTMVSWISGTLGTIIDLHYPALNWTDEQEIFKMRYIPLLSFLIQIFVFGAAILAIWRLPYFTGVWQTFLAMSVVLVIAIYLGNHLLKKAIQKHYFHML